MDRAAFVSKAALRPAWLAPTKRACVDTGLLEQTQGQHPGPPAAGREPDPQSSLPEAPYTAMGQQNPGCLESCWGACKVLVLGQTLLARTCHCLLGSHRVWPPWASRRPWASRSVMGYQCPAPRPGPPACCREQGGVWVVPPPCSECRAVLPRWQAVGSSASPSSAFGVCLTRGLCWGAGSPAVKPVPGPVGRSCRGWDALPSSLSLGVRACEPSGVLPWSVRGSL